MIHYNALFSVFLLMYKMYLDLFSHVLPLTYLQLQNIPGAEWQDCEILEESQLHYSEI